MAKKLTLAQWKEVQDAISIFHQVKLKIDGFDIYIGMEQDPVNMKLWFMVWVNNQFNGTDMDKESVIGEKFYTRRYFYHPSKKFCNAMIKAIGKRKTKKEYGEPKKVLLNYSPHFKSFRTLKKVLTDNNESIEIISL